MSTEKIRIGLDKKGGVVENLKDAVRIVETEYDEKGNVVKEITYAKKTD